MRVLVPIAIAAPCSSAGVKREVVLIASIISSIFFLCTVPAHVHVAQRVAIDALHRFLLDRGPNQFPNESLNYDRVQIFAARLHVVHTSGLQEMLEG